MTTWLEKDIIEEIPRQPYTNNIVVAIRKDGRTRICIDCTPANKVTEEFNWPLPRLQDIRYFTRHYVWFTRLDLTDAFHRILVPEEYRYLTAFCCNRRTYQFKGMPFGLKTAPSTFQRFMDWGLSHLGEWALWYIDDILIGAENRSTLRQRTALVHEQLVRMKCVVNEKKSAKDIVDEMVGDAVKVINQSSSALVSKSRL